MKLGPCHEDAANPSRIALSVSFAIPSTKSFDHEASRSSSYGRAAIARSDAVFASPVGEVASHASIRSRPIEPEAVSYTHLTLPTILLV